MDLQPNKTDAVYLPITNTRISASEWNQLVGSCMAFITAAGFTPDAADNEQFLNAFKAIAASLELVGANTNLSNLTATGEGHFANPSLSNVTAVGTSSSAGWSMPSDTYENLTFGASGTTYTAPANGYFVFHFSNSGLSAHWVNILINDVFIGNWWAQVANNTFAIPEYMVRKGDTFKIEYGSDITGAWIARFYYAEGSKSEAN